MIDETLQVRQRRARPLPREERLYGVSAGGKLPGHGRPPVSSCDAGRSVGARAHEGIPIGGEPRPDRFDDVAGEITDGIERRRADVERARRVERRGHERVQRVARDIAGREQRAQHADAGDGDRLVRVRGGEPRGGQGARIGHRLENAQNRRSFT